MLSTLAVQTNGVELAFHAAISSSIAPSKSAKCKVPRPLGCALDPFPCGAPFAAKLSKINDSRLTGIP